MILTIIVTAYLSSALYYGSFVSTCTYSESEVPLPPIIQNSTIKVIKEAVIVSGREPERECLDILGKVNKEFSEVRYQQYSKYKDPQRTFTQIMPEKNLNFYPYKNDKAQNERS